MHHIWGKPSCSALVPVLSWCHRSDVSCYGCCLSIHYSLAQHLAVCWALFLAFFRICKFLSLDNRLCSARFACLTSNEGVHLSRLDLKPVMWFWGLHPKGGQGDVVHDVPRGSPLIFDVNLRSVTLPVRSQTSHQSAPWSLVRIDIHEGFLVSCCRRTSATWPQCHLKVMVKTTMAAYNTFVITTQLYSSETWTTYAKQERRQFNTHRGHIFGHVYCIQDSCISKDRPPVRRAGLWDKSHWTPETAIPCCYKVGHEDHWHGVVGGSGSQPNKVERNPDQTPQVGVESDEGCGEKASMPKEETPTYQRPHTNALCKCDFCTRDCHSHIGLKWCCLRWADSTETPRMHYPCTTLSDGGL